MDPRGTSKALSSREVIDSLAMELDQLYSRIRRSVKPSQGTSTAAVGRTLLGQYLISQIKHYLYRW
ncbi:unnamed protein product [Soboliphyme baturini]|uniref:RNA-directed DNA polymerase n=1 Tax=Soboliphyme baturini TaxID=241478 RepID=A0A183J984_9BILA|nr:unnamed protein product [Soboliphyme baturini]